MKSALIILFCISMATLRGQEIEITPEGHEIMSVYFAGGRYYLDGKQAGRVHQWLQSKINLHEYEIMLHSHTDNIGSIGYNQFLSKMRSESVIQALEEIFINREDIRVNDFGELNPLFDNQTMEGRLNNRRVDIIIFPPSS